MKWVKTFFLLFLVIAPAYSGQAIAIDLDKDNPKTLIGTKSTDYTIYGLRLGLTHEQTWKILGSNNFLLGKRNDRTPSRIDVHSRSNDGSKGESVLALIWGPGERELSRITVFQGARSSLSQSFRRSLTFEAIDANSDFKRRFIGYANRSKTGGIPSIGMKTTTHFYDDIGLEIAHVHISDGEEVVFSIVQPRP